MKVKFLILLLFLTINAQALNQGVTIPLVAFHSTPEGGEGILLKAQVIVTNGSGHVFVDTSPYTQVDLQGSARLAAMVASDVLGIDQRKYDFYYIIDIDSPIIGGPSAGGALTVATIAAIKNWTLRKGIVMTGMINPDESIGPVGGIPHKLEAAAKYNATLFLIPEGQREVVVRKTISRRQGPFIIYEEKQEMVDLYELGKKLNIKVKEVSTIQQAVQIFTGHNITRQTYKGRVFTSQYLSLLKPLATNLREEAKHMYQSTGDSSSLNVNEIMKRADSRYSEKKYYAATSLYFNAMYLMRYLQWAEGYRNAGDKDRYLMELINDVKYQIEQSKEDLNKFKSNGIMDVEAVGAAESRITAASEKLNEAIELKDIDEKISTLAFAYERARTARWWLSLATPDKIIPEETLKERAGWYLSQAQSIHTYTQTLFSESGHVNILNGAGKYIERAQKEIQQGYYSGAIFDSLHATVISSTNIGLFGDVNVSKKVEQSANAANAAINQARMHGIEPTLAISAYEFAETLSNPYDKIVQYSYAKMVAKTTVVLGSHGISTNKTPIKPVITPYIPKISTPQVQVTETNEINKSPAFEVIIAIVALLVMKRWWRD